MAITAVVGTLMLTGCGADNDSDPSANASPSVVPTTSAHQAISPTTVVRTSSVPQPSIALTSTTNATSTTPPAMAGNASGVLEFVDGALLGIHLGSLLSAAAESFGLTPAHLADVESDPPVRACTGTPAPWAIRSGGLIMVFEGDSAETAILTNWTYTGGPVAGFAEIVAPHDVRIGDPRADVVEANPDGDDYGDEIHVGSPFYLRYGIDNDVVAWFGIIDCAFEQVPADPVHEWVRGRWEAFALNAALGVLLDGLDRDDLDELSGFAETCAGHALLLSQQSSLDAVVPNQEQGFADIASTCSSIAASLASGDSGELANTAATLAEQMDPLAEIFDACDELMYIGDANEPAATYPSP